jgi:hypothetical protein
MQESWSFKQLNYETLNQIRPDRPRKKSGTIWASELGKSFIDVELRMRATEPSNPPDNRARGKFDAGNFWENIVKNVFIRAGILQEDQVSGIYQYPGLLPVWGRMDLMAGGRIDYERSKKVIDTMPDYVPKSLLAVVRDSLEAWQKDHPDGLKKIIFEVKSTSQSMFEIYQAKGAGENHKLQLYHYLKMSNMDEGHVLYVCRDDVRLAEFAVFQPSTVEDDYKAWIEMMTGLHNLNLSDEDLIANHREPLVTFDDQLFKFRPNWKVAYSNYLSLIYKRYDSATDTYRPYAHQEEYAEEFRNLTSKWNRVIARIVTDKPMTKSNQEYLKDIEAHFSKVWLEEKIELIKKSVKEGKVKLDEDENLGVDTV